MSETPTIQQAVRALASRCDGAFAQDGKGFNGRDARFGASLAAIPHDRWSPRQLEAAYGMLMTYRGQLNELGIDLGLVRKPAAEVEAQAAAAAAAPPKPGGGRIRPCPERPGRRVLLSFP